MHLIPENLKTTALNYFKHLDEQTLKKLYIEAEREINDRIKACRVVEQIETEDFGEIERDITDSIHNLTLSLIQYEEDRQKFGGQFKNIFEFAHHFNVKETIFEQCVTLGHPFHPMTKTKLGLTYESVLRYAPEFRNSVNIIPVITESEVSHFGKGQLPEYYLDQLHDVAAQYNIEHPSIIFIHEWQLNNYLNEHPSLLNDSTCIPIKSLSVMGYPLLSFRTLYVPMFKCVIKTAVNAQATSAVRNVSPASIHNGVLLGKYVSKLFEQYDGCFIQQDLVGTSLKQSQHENKLSYMMRETIPYEDHQYAVVCASLISKSFITDQVIVIEAIDIIRHHQRISREAAAMIFFEKYTHILLKATYQLMLEHQISLEAHMQNSSIVLENGVPKAIYIRDFGGIRISDDSVHIDKRTGLFTNDFEDLLSVFTHAVLYNHLFQLIKPLSAFVNEQKLYDTIYQEIATINEAYKPPVNVLKQRKLKVKSLLKMRLYGDSYDYKYSEIKNPLMKEDFRCGKA
ncbi:siderophore biosynthesis protein, IucA/IucC family [Macrococcoides canis]|uniref:IucA/IucC family protein n=1 Tax=Macrococcoides canis TaxID=1855823 RepID=UPI001F1891ED|nr:IucA/IucC family protein [Macrococcus canis]UJS27491.1 siderophore biosynthesis protein, IucA/IucC family [Macrococcus canis]